MSRGMRRTTIMSHGGRHDAQGVKGTHLAGTIPPKAVMDAIPVSQNTVGNLPEVANPGTAGETTRVAGHVQVRPTKMRMDEGIPVIPGGNRDAGRGPSTSRPQLDDASDPVPTRSTSGQVPDPVSTHDDLTASQIRRSAEADEAAEAVAPEQAEETPPTAPSEPRSEALTPPVDDQATQESEARTEAPSASGDAELLTPLPTSKRKLVRANTSTLRTWCNHLKIVPEEYVTEDDDVTTDLMRVLIGDHLGIEHGIELPEEEETEEETETEVVEEAPDEEQDED